MLKTIAFCCLSFFTKKNLIIKKTLKTSEFNNFETISEQFWNKLHMHREWSNQNTLGKVISNCQRKRLIFKLVLKVLKVLFFF